MPTYTAYDLFCFDTGIPVEDTTFNFADATLLEPVEYEANSYVGDTPWLRFDGFDPNPSVFGGSPAVDLKAFNMDATFTDGSTGTLTGHIVETADGNSYVAFNDFEGDFQIATGEFTGIYTQREPLFGGHGKDNDQTGGVACFTRGMEIRTEAGNRPIEDLVAGDLVWTLDNGFQPLRYIASRSVPAQGSMIPVVFEKGAIGNTERLIVSAKHRFHVKSLPSQLADQLAPHTDTLLQATAFVNGTTVRFFPEIETVEYVHLMFDDHQLVECFGTVSESWQPTRNALALGGEVADELAQIFPELATRQACDPGAMVRSELRLKGQSRH